MMSALVEAHDVCHTLRHTPIVDHATISLEPGRLNVISPGA